MELSMVPYGDVDVKPSRSEASPATRSIAGVWYRECMRNHAASIGGHASDGCCEFMEGPSLKCAACGCHRNFHRKEVPGGGCAEHYPGPHHPLLVYNARAHHPLLPSPHQMISAVDLGGSRGPETPQEGGSAEFSVSGKKRFRTKFMQEQKEKMVEFAEKLGWRIQKENDVELEKFCSEVGVKRQVLKVWMHNNKNTLGKKQEANKDSAAISV